jgi:hypothetical protein
MDGIELDDTVRVSKGRPRHKPVAASQLRAGDLVQAGVGTNYWQVFTVTGRLDGQVAVQRMGVDAPWVLNPHQEMWVSTHGMTDAEITEVREPHCNHDAPAVRNGVCECGAKVSPS